MLGTVLRRTGLTLLATVVFLAASLYITLYNVAHGVSPTVRNILVQSAKQASATKWVPGLFFDEATVNEIVNASSVTETIEISDLLPEQPVQNVYVSLNAPEQTEGASPPDPWENAVDGMILEEYIGPTFKAHVLLVKDPSRVYVAKPNWDFGYNSSGVRVMDLVKDETIAAVINGGGFYDPGGVGSGGVPLGITYAGGKCVWEDTDMFSFVGLDNDNKLIARNSMTLEEADEMGIRDGVCFQQNNVLVSTEDGSTNAYYADADASLAQRTAIGQKEDGTIILMVTEGRTAAYLGANRNDIINAMLSYDAVTAAMLDGGSSTVMCYPGYHEKYNIDTSRLDKYQKMGLVNQSRAFMGQRSIPTYFAVKKS